MLTPVVRHPEESGYVSMHVVGADSSLCPTVTSAVIDPFFSLCFLPCPQRYGKIVSTKAILDKTTNKCKGE